MSSTRVQFSQRTGIRNRVNRFSDSVLSMLSDSSVVGKQRASHTRPAIVFISKTVVSLFLLSFFFLFLSITIEVIIDLRPTSLKLSRLLGVDIQQPLKYLNVSISDDLPVDTYPLILVNESQPFHPSPHHPAVVDSEADAFAEEADEGTYATVSTPNSEDEVYHYQPDAPTTEDRKVPNKEATHNISNEKVETAITVTTARLIVLTMNRAKSLQRLLDSLVNALYGNDIIDLDVWIDRAENATSVDETVLSVSRNITWKQGTKTIHKRRSNAGLYEQWIYTWNLSNPTTSSEFAVILEDDLQVSPKFYKWLLLARAAYAQDEEVAAFTLQRPTLRPRQRKGIASGPLNISTDHQVFKYRLLGTWGFAPLREHWIEFRKWYELSRVRGDKPYVDHLMTTTWYKEQEGKDGFAPRMWSQWWIRFAEQRNYFTVTANLPDGTTLAANWREPGLHYAHGEPTADFPVFQGSADQFVMPPDNPVLVDWDGQIIPDREAHSP